MVQTELDVLRDLSSRLVLAGVDFMLTGSLAMNYYALPRMTRDIDVVVSLGPGDAERLVQLFSPDYYVDPDQVAEALERRSIFNMIHHESVIKVDCIVLKGEPYRLEEFARRQSIKVGDFRTWIVTREDLILSKLYWAKDTRSEIQLNDAFNLLVPGCDVDYLRSGAQLLGILGLLEETIRKHE